MFNTPLGNLHLYINGRELSYNYHKLKTALIGSEGIPIFDVEERYKITINIKDTIFPILVKCEFNEDDEFNDTNIESGEQLALKSWYKGNLKFSIGTYDYRDIIEGYKVEYFRNGLGVYLIDNLVNEIVFCIAWIHMKDIEKEDIYTWFAADPSYS